MSPKIMTASWFSRLPAGHRIIGISRGSPRGTPGGYRMYRSLAPGPWFKSVSPAEYIRLYSAILDALDPQKVADDLCAIAGDGITPVIVCFESPAKIQFGEQWCRRHLAARWLQDRLGMTIEEIGAPPVFDAFVKLRAAGVPEPRYVTSER